MDESVRHASFIAGVEVREGQGGVSILGGYAAVFNQETIIDAPGGMRWRERIAPTAFADSIGRDDVLAAVNHDRNQVLGRTKAGTLTLKADAHGLRYDVTLPKTSLARDTVENVRTGILAGSSFKFIVPDGGLRVVKARHVDDLSLVIIERVKLLDVGPVVQPAYEGTSVSLRSMSESVVALLQRAPVEDDRGLVQRLRAKIAIEQAKAWG